MAMTSGSAQHTSSGAGIPGGVKGLSTHTPAASAGHAPQVGAPAPVAAQAVANTVLGPVPMVVPTLADALSHAGALPWNWFLALGLVDALLMTLIVVRRRRAAASAA